MADQSQPAERPGRERRVALLLSVAWGIAMIAYALGYFGLIDGIERPLLALDILLILLAAILPPVLIWAAAILCERARMMLAETRRVAARIPSGGASLPHGFDPEELAAALVQAARQATAEERADLLALVSRLETRLDAALNGPGATTDGDAPHHAAIGNALARMESMAAAEREEREAVLTEARAAAAERDEIRAALARMEARTGSDGPAPAGDRTAIAEEREEIRAALARIEEHAARTAEERAHLSRDAEAVMQERAELVEALARVEHLSPGDMPAAPAEGAGIRAALARMEEAATRALEDRAAYAAAAEAAAAEREEVRAALARMEESARARSEDKEMFLAERQAMEAEREEIRAALARMEANAAARLADEEERYAEARAAAAERDEIRAALARMEEKTAAAIEESRRLTEERAEIRAALTRMEAQAAAAAEDKQLLRDEREAALAERDQIRAALHELEERTLGSVEEERARLAETLSRLEAQQVSSGIALSTLLDRRDAAEDLSRLRRTPEPAATDTAQPDLPLDQQAPPPGPDWADIVRALNFPLDETDQDGFRAMRRAMRDRQVAECLQSSEDVLTLLSQDGVYMDDLMPEEVPAALWIRFSQGARGPEMAALGAIDDEEALEQARARLKSDPVFRDASLHFLRRFDVVLRRLCDQGSETEIRALGDTRTGRAFMLLARAHGTFD